MKTSLRRTSDTRRLLALLNTMEAPCTDCEDGTVPNTDALATWQQRMDALRPNYVPDNPYCGGSVAYFAALNERPPKQITCPACAGNGVALTETGRAVVGFLARYGIGGAR